MMAIAQRHVPTCRIRNIQESYRYDDMELQMDQTDASKMGNRTFEYVGVSDFSFPSTFIFNNNNNNSGSE